MNNNNKDDEQEFSIEISPKNNSTSSDLSNEEREAKFNLLYGSPEVNPSNEEFDNNDSVVNNLQEQEEIENSDENREENYSNEGFDDNDSFINNLQGQDEFEVRDISEEIEDSNLFSEEIEDSDENQDFRVQNDIDNSDEDDDDDDLKNEDDYVNVINHNDTDDENQKENVEFPNSNFENNENSKNNENSDEQNTTFTPKPKDDYATVTKKPPIINKKLISSLIIGGLVSVVVVVMGLSIFTGKKKDNKKIITGKQDATKTTLSDFKSQVEPNIVIPSGLSQNADAEENSSAIVGTGKQGRNTRGLNGKTGILKGADGINYEYVYDENGNPVLLGPIKDDDGNIRNEKGEIVYNNKEQQQKSQPNQQQYHGEIKSGKSTWTPPDTRNDALQAKTIKGIKGITPTQNRYATNYEEQIEKNAATVAAENNPFSNLAGTSGMLSLPSKEDYTKNLLAMQKTMNKSDYQSQNNQENKISFHNSGKENAGNGEWLGLNTLWEGTIFEAELKTAINTDLPGEITAVITKNVYSSQDGRYLLIPQNSILIGSYNSEISYAQSRVQVAWNTIIRPDGYRIDLGNFNGVDAQGASGIKGRINEHIGQYIKAIFIMSLFNIISNEFDYSMKNNDNLYAQNVLANSQAVATELGNKLIDRAMDIQPTIKIKEGTIVKIFVNRTLSLPPLDPVPVTQPYRKY